jgi:hypothetical protein
MEGNAEKYTCSKIANCMRRRNGEPTETQLLASSPTKFSPPRHSHHGVTLDVQSKNRSARRNYASQSQVCLSGILTSLRFSQVKDVIYWESFSPVVSFTTIRLLITLTALPHWHSIHYDVSVAFITAEIDPTQTPIYCRPAEDYEPRTENVYLLKRYLYGMKDSPRGYNLHFNSVCLNFGLKRCISDECIYIKIESN